MTNSTRGNRKATPSKWISWLSCAVLLWGIVTAVFPQAAVALDWTARNGPEGGYVAHIAVDFTDPNIMYLSNFGGIFKTTNGATSWTDLHAYFGAAQIFLDPTNHTTVYVVGGNIVKSTDAGANWTILDTKLPCGDGVRTMVLDPQNSSILYATIVTKIGNTPDYYVIKSTNGGTSWNQLTWKAYALAIDPINSSILYACTTAGLQKSIDGGVTWIPSGTGLGSAANLGTVVIDPKTPTTLYVVADGVVCKSTNSGGQWQFSSNGWESFGGLVAEDLIIDPLSPNNLYVVVRGGGHLSTTPGTIYVTTNGGGQWGPLLFGPPNTLTDVQVVALAPSSPDNLYAGTLQHGVFKSVYNGTAWGAFQTKNSGLKALIQYMALDPSDKNVIYAGIPALGVFRSSDGGNNWVSLNAGLGSVSVAALAISPVGSHTLWVSLDNAVTPSTGGSLPGIFKSNDGGATWTVTISPPGNFLSSAPTKLIADPVNPDGLYALAIPGVYRTTDGGTTWLASRNGVPDNAFLNSLAIDPKDPTNLYLGLYESTSGNSVYKSTDYGVNWLPSSTGLPHLQGIYDLAIDPKTSSTVYAAVLPSTTINGGVFKSIDSGGSWQDTTSDVKPLITGYTLAQYDNIHYAGAIPNCPSPFLTTAFNLAIDSNAPSTLFAVVNGLVLRSTDAASSWTVAHSGLPFSPYQIGISPADQTAAYSANQGIYLYTGIGGSEGGGGGGGGGTATVLVTAPNGGENWLVGSSNNITWTNTGTINNVKIETSSDGGTSYSTVIASTPNTGSYNWTVPDSPSTTVKIRISNDDGSISDISDGNFTISTSGGGGGGGDGGIFSDLFVPVVLSTNGDGGSFFTTELTFTNRGTLTANVDLSYTATSGEGSGIVSTTIPPGQSVFSDAIDYLKTLGLPIPDSGSRVGTLRTHFSNLSTESDASITARLTTEVKDSSGALIGRAGLAYPALSISSSGGAAISQVKNSPGDLQGGASLASAALGDVAFIYGLRQNATDRSNVAFQNVGTTADGIITLEATVFDGDTGAGHVLPPIVLTPGAFFQISGVLSSNGLSLTNGYIRVQRTSGNALFYAYGVVNDQVNSDGSFVIPQVFSTTPVYGLTLPVIVQTSTFSSELVVTNNTGDSTTIDFDFAADAITTADKRAHFSISLGNGEQRIIPDIFTYMRDHSVAGVPPAETTIAGALFATTTGGGVNSTAGDINGVFLAARTSAAGGAAGGRFGLFYTAVPYGDASTTSAWVFGLQQDAENRTNLAIVNTGEADTNDDTFVIDLYDGATGILVETTAPIILKARGWIQIGSILNNAPGVQQGYAQVRRTAGNNPFITYAVINDGAGPGQRTGDGAFIGSSQ